MQKTSVKTAPRAKVAAPKTKRSRQGRTTTTKKGVRNLSISRALLSKIYATASPEGQKAMEAEYPNLLGSNERYRLGGVVELKVGKFTYQMLISLAKNRKGSKLITLTNIENGSRWNNSVSVRNVKAITRLEMMNLVGSQNIGGLSKLADKVAIK